MSQTRQVKSWGTISSDSEALERRDTFWKGMSKAYREGRFWSEEIKQFHDDPVARRDFALRHLPLPAAFREAMIALRSIIRAKRKAKEDWEPELIQLYRLAAVDSFRLDYSKRLQQPGYNVMEVVPGDKLISLPIDYRRLGTGKLRLLNKTDVKWLEDRYGKPRAHTTLNALHQDLWRRYEDLLIAEQKERDGFGEWLEELARDPNDRPTLTTADSARFATRSHPSRWLKPKLWLALGALAGALLLAAAL